MTYDEPKFTELVMYAANRLRDDPTAGATKLNKVLYYAEFGHMRAYGRPISGAVFRKRERGPAPHRLVPVRRQLIDTGQAHIEKTAFLGYSQDRLVPDREPDGDALSPEERASVEQAIELLSGMNGSDVSEFSHAEMGYRLVGDDEEIPYETAYLRPPTITEGIRRQAQKIAAELNLA